MGKELWLFTMRFPFGNAESFLENEVPVLCKHFDHVRIFPAHADGTARALPANASVTTLFKDPFRYAHRVRPWRHRKQLLALLGSLVRDVRLSRNLVKELRVLMSRIKHLISRMQDFQHKLLPEFDPERVILYSFWTHDWATVLGLLKLEDPGIHFISRAHGFDLYEEQSKSRYIPFRTFQVRQVDRIFCVSSYGLEHIRARHPEHPEKFELFRLGTTDHGLSRKSEAGPLQVVSCSYVIPRKRVEMIAAALMQVKEEIHWTHFGDGRGMKDLRAITATLPPHVTVDLKGNMDNHAILRHYADHPVDVILLTSSLEGGVAVVLQEASSFGIPLIATDSGGVRDIVTPATGILLPRDPDVGMIANVLDGFRKGPMATTGFRQGVRAFWEQNFEAEKAYSMFCERLEQWHAEVRPDRKN